MDFLNVRDCLSHFEDDFIEELEMYSTLKEFSKNEYIIKGGQVIRFLPIVLSGCVKIFSNEDTKQFLLYYINVGNSCIFSFAHIQNKTISEFSAIADVDSVLLLLPMDKVLAWQAKYQSFNKMLLSAYQKHYYELLDSMKQIVLYNLEERLLQYLLKRAKIEKSNLLKVTHQEIADDLNSSREVISRLMKKTSVNKKVIQEGRSIKVLL